MILRLAVAAVWLLVLVAQHTAALDESAEVHRNRQLFDTPANAVPSAPWTFRALDHVNHHDTTEGNLGNCGGDDPVDAKITAPTSSCTADCYISHTAPGEWVEYEFQTLSSQDGVPVDIALLVASDHSSDSTVALELDGTDLGTLDAPGRGWHEFVERAVAEVAVPASAAPHRLRVIFPEGGVNLCSISVSTLRVPFTAPALEYAAFSDSGAPNEGNCATRGGDVVDAKYTASGDSDNPTCSSECYVSHTKPGEWLEYTFWTAHDALVEITAKVASQSDSRRFRMRLDDRYVSDTLLGPGEGWHVFRERHSKRGAYIKGGTMHRLRVEFVNGGINLCSVQVILTSTIVPDRDGPITRIQAQNYNGFRELSPEVNHGGACDRGDGVDMQPTSDGGICNVGWTEAGEHLEYSITVKQGQLYHINARLASNSSPRFVHLEVDGEDVSGPKEVTTMGWKSFWDRNLVNNFYLAPGFHTLRIVFESGRVNLNYIDVIGQPRKPFDVAAFLPRMIRTCFVGDRCESGSLDCVGLMDDSWNVQEGFTRDTFASVKPEDAYGDSVCLDLELEDSDVDRIEQSLGEFAAAQYRDSAGEIELKVQTVQIGEVNLALTRSWGGDWGFFVTPLSIRSSAVAALDFVPDFSFIVPPSRDPTLELQHGIDYGGLAFGSWDPIAGSMTAWVPNNYALAGYFGHEWLHLLGFAYHDFSYIPDIYPNQSDLPPCGEGHWNSREWFPSVDWCQYDPDFVSCGDGVCTEHEIWGEHILREHFNPGVPFVANHCKNGIQDYGETAVDYGGECFDLS